MAAAAASGYPVGGDLAVALRARQQADGFRLVEDDGGQRDANLSLLDGRHQVTSSSSR
jgi:hypothetical protein